MKKMITAISLSLFLVSCATEKIIPVGRIRKITSSNTAIVNYPESDLKVGHDVNLIRVYWTMGRRGESLRMPGKVEKVLSENTYEIKFDGTHEISETNIVRK